MRALAAHVHSVPDALQTLRELYAAQLARAHEEKAAPNTSVDGDGAARSAFLTLLPPEEQRAFFLTTIQRREFWPRIRTLFGAPPFSFLRPEDDGVLRAAGISAKRTHMAHDEATATNYSEFGEGHFTDHAGRLYKVIAKKRAHSRAELPWQGLRAMRSFFACDILATRTSRTTRPLALAGLVFPRVGDVLRLRTVSALAPQPSASSDAGGSEEDDDGLSARVSLGRQKERNSPVARLVVDVV